jgi:hypothetical protein
VILKKRKFFSRFLGTKLRDNTISSDGWAFHYGGRKELQFNIGIEEEETLYRFSILQQFNFIVNLHFKFFK